MSSRNQHQQLRVVESTKPSNDVNGSYTAINQMKAHQGHKNQHLYAQLKPNI
jgi:hypothetical protein